MTDEEDECVEPLRDSKATPRPKIVKKRPPPPDDDEEDDDNDNDGRQQKRRLQDSFFDEHLKTLKAQKYKDKYEDAFAELELIKLKKKVLSPRECMMV